MSQPLPSKSIRLQKDLTPLALDIISQLGNKLERRNPRWDLIDKMRPKHSHTFFFGDCLFAAEPRRNERVYSRDKESKRVNSSHKWFPATIQQAKFNHDKFRLYKHG